jgi:hypothetical protein
MDLLSCMAARKQKMQNDHVVPEKRNTANENPCMDWIMIFKLWNFIINSRNAPQLSIYLYPRQTVQAILLRQVGYQQSYTKRYVLRGKKKRCIAIDQNRSAYMVSTVNKIRTNTLFIRTCYFSIHVRKDGNAEKGKVVEFSTLSLHWES